MSGGTVINWNVTGAEARTIRHIAERAVREARKDGVRLDKVDVEMNVTAVHANGCPLRLDELRDADTFNFWHDINGIARHLDRESGQLRNCFVPRFARRSV